MKLNIAGAGAQTAAAAAVGAAAAVAAVAVVAALAETAAKQNENECTTQLQELKALRVYGVLQRSHIYIHTHIYMAVAPLQV